MLQNEKINKHQLKVLTSLFITGSLITPPLITAVTKQDLWISIILGNIILLLIVFLYNKVADFFVDVTLIQYSQKVLGKWIGNIVACWFVLFLLLGSAYLLWSIENFIVTQIMPETPMLAIGILLMIVVIYACRLGIETAARAAEVLYPWVILVVIITFSILMLPRGNIKNIQPILESGIKSVLEGALLYPLSFFRMPAVSLMIYPVTINKYKEAKKYFYLGILIGGGMFTLQSFDVIFLMGAENTSRQLYPAYAAAKMIKLGEFFTRVEVLIAIPWIIAMFYDIMLYFYGAALGIAQILNLKDYKKITLPLGIIEIILASIIFPSTTYFLSWSKATAALYVFTNGIIIPLILVGVGRFRGR